MRLRRADVPSLYALTPAGSDLPLSRTVERLASAGVRWIQVREKRRDDLDVWRDLQSASAVVSSSRLFVNDRLDLALAAGAWGVHLGDRDLPAAVARKLAPELIIGVSTHDEEAAIAAADDGAVDYVAIGPIFESPTKNVRRALGPDVIARVRSAIAKPIIAIGGIDATNIRTVLDAGADSVAIISALYVGGAIETNVERILEAAGRRP